MLDFKELSKDGLDLEQLIRELLFARGFRVYWSGKGADGGRDLLCYETHESLFEADTKAWLIQCKHYALSGKSVGTDDVENIVDSCKQHGASGYLLACSTQPSAALVEKLEAISKNASTGVLATYWDSVHIERLLTTPRIWPVAQRFFPHSANASGWQIYATAEPNRWVANYKGYYFHLTNRIGSEPHHHLASIEERIKNIEAITLPAEHLIRPRAIFYDDKHGEYTWYMDYMYPRGQTNAVEVGRLLYTLGDGYSWTDGQMYGFEINRREYTSFSEHYDKDHYDYYLPYLDVFVGGSFRKFKYPSIIAGITPNTRLELENTALKYRDQPFAVLVEALKRLPGVSVVRAINCMVEYLDDFRSGESWIGVASEFGFDVDRFFSAKIILSVSKPEVLFKAVREFPNGGFKHYRLSRVYWLSAETPDEAPETEDFDLVIALNPAGVDNKYELRGELNKYFGEITKAIDSCVPESHS